MVRFEDGWARLEPRGGLRLARGLGCWPRAAVAVAADRDDEMGMHRTPIRGWIFLAHDQRRLHELGHFVLSRVMLLRWRWREYRIPYPPLGPRVSCASTTACRLFLFCLRVASRHVHVDIPTQSRFCFGFALELSFSTAILSMWHAGRVRLPCQREEERGNGRDHGR
ncbi:hypothetical protein C8R45DRAFT_301415 [Mycena sanguinolenta]|nr:hypothetical protein C8R45DRAFT_301415 [Mycena sanguinolenta]